MGILNPNRLLVLPGSAASFSYHSRLELEGHQRAAMSDWFRAGAPLIAQALQSAEAEDGLFQLPKEIRLKS